MNIPNKITTFRVFLTPIFVFFFIVGKKYGPSNWAALSVFIIASITDAIDGKIARKFNIITNFGKFADPLADKILVLAALLCLIDVGKVSSIIVMLIISREFAVTCLRLVASSDGNVISANFSGKLKTVLQITSIIFGLLSICLPNITAISTIFQILILTATTVTLISGILYIWKNKNILTGK